jgi:hypothetical protein
MLLVWAALLLGSTLPLLGQNVAGSDPPKPLTLHERFDHYMRSVTGPGAIGKSLFTAGMKEWLDRRSEWGQGTAGYSRRFSYCYARRVTGNGIEFGVGHFIGEDPRYFRSTSRGVLSRAGHAVTSAFIAPTDGGGRRFAFARFAGAYGGAAVSNAWYPERLRGPGQTLERGSFSIAGEVSGNLFREFWPDIKRLVLRRR